VRLWSIHPKHLDRQGLVALWRESLLAQKVLRGETRGYRSHPQLRRFSETSDPLLAIGSYLAAIAEEAGRRGYTFDRSRITKTGTPPLIQVGAGQVEYEWNHLLSKLKTRAPKVYETNRGLPAHEVHPLFQLVPGGVEDWEKI
jgi:hypothetical protein